MWFSFYRHQNSLNEKNICSLKASNEYWKLLKMYHLQKLKEEELAREREENAAAGEDGKKESLPPIVCIYFLLLSISISFHFLLPHSVFIHFYCMGIHCPFACVNSSFGNWIYILFLYVFPNHLLSSITWFPFITYLHRSHCTMYSMHIGMMCIRFLL